MKTILFAIGLTMIAALGSTDSSSQVTTIQVQGMSCGGCAAAVASALKQVDGVTDARVSYEQRQAVVMYDPAKTTPEGIARAAEERLPGYKFAVGGSTVNAKESPKACARPA